MMQMSTSPGVLSGDRYDIEYVVESGARLHLASQSYQRLYDMDGEAQQSVSVTIGDGAHFSQVPHPIVPHRNSAYSSHTQVRMGEGSTFMQSEIITCGRRHHGEEFLFRNFSNSVEIYDLDGRRLRLKDRVWLNPQQMPLQGCGLLEGWTHHGTLIFQSTQSGDQREAIEQIYREFESSTDILFGISATHYNGFVVRILGSGGEPIFEIFTKIEQMMWGR